MNISSAQLLKEVERLKREAEGLANAGDLAGALQLLAQAEQTAENHPLALALVWRGRANVYLRHEHFAQSLAAAEQAVALYTEHGTPFDVAVASVAKVYALGALEQYDAAIALAHHIRPHLVRRLPIGLAHLTNNLAQVYTWAWRNQEALQAYRQARRLYLRLGQPALAASMLHNMGVAAEQLDQLTLARRYYTQAYPVLVQAGNTFMLVKTQLNLAALHIRTNAYEKALAHLAQARHDLAQLPASPDGAYLDLFEAQVRLALHEPAQAQALLEQALAAFETMERQVEVAQTCLELGRLALQIPQTLMQGWLYLERAEAALAPHKLPLLQALVALASAEALMRLGRLPEALPRAAQAQATFAQAQLPMRQAQADVLWATCLLPSDPAAARAAYQRVLHAIGATLPALALQAWWGLGQVATQLQEWSTAEAAYTQAFAYLEQMRGTLHTPRHQAGLSEQHGVNEILDALCHVLHQQAAPPPRLFYCLEREQARVLAAWQARALPTLAAGVGVQKLLTERAQLRRELDHLQSQWFAGPGVVEGAVTRAPAWVKQDLHQQAQLVVLQQRLGRVEENLRRVQAKAQTHPPVGVLADVEQQLAQLPADTLLIAYYTAQSQLYALTATRQYGDIQRHALGVSLETIETRWWQMRRWVMEPRVSLAEVQPRLGYLWRLLLQPLILRLNQYPRLLFLPQRGLWQIPFAALYDATAQTYLMERWSWHTAPSLNVWAHCPIAPSHTQALLVGYPGEPGQIGYLPGVLAEIQAVHAYWPQATVLLAEQATASATLAALPNKGLVHFAGHIVYDAQAPLNSGLPLMAGQWLRAADWHWLGAVLQGALVVLSGCNSARGQSLGGEQLGLTHALFTAGARAILATLWPVDDATTVTLMKAFYHARQLGQDLAEGLRQAQQTLLAQSAYAHPAYWAPFSLCGQAV